jgi:hypothetical protein
MAAEPTIAEFYDALETVGLPGGRQCKFLQRHFDVSGRAATMTQLARAAKYVSFHGMNLQYGLLATRLGSAMGRYNASLTLLVDFIPPRGVTNREWVLVMKPKFAAALKRAGWVT